MPRKVANADLRMIAEVVTEMARHRGSSFDKVPKGHTFGRAALIDPGFRARLAEVHRRLVARRRPTDLPPKMLAPISPLFRDLEREAEAVLSGWKASQDVNS